MKYLLLIILGLLGIFSCSGKSPSIEKNSFSFEVLIDSNIEKYLAAEGTQKLYLPNLTRSLYRQNNYTYLWFNPQDKEQLVRDAMSLLDCLAQYGLNTSFYHTTDITYDNVRLLTTDIAPNSSALKAKTDVLLTDAVLSFIVHLHFGRMNPNVSLQQIDQEGFRGYRVDSVLNAAIRSPEKFSQIILSAQPQAKGYRQLQDYLRLATAQYTGDCYEPSGDTLRLIAINLERYKWNNIDDSVYVDINIPAFTLKYVEADNIQTYKVIIGKASTPTPILNSEIRYFTTAPHWNVPASIFRKELLPKALANPAYLSNNNLSIYAINGQRVVPTYTNLKMVQSASSGYFARQSPGRNNSLGQIVFNFENPYSVYLHDTPNRKLFNQANRALSHGCIRLENPRKFVTRVLKHDSAPANVYSTVYNSMDSYKRFRYTLKKPIPIVIRYITCEIQNGILVQYSDLYKRDKPLTDKLFKSN